MMEGSLPTKESTTIRLTARLSLIQMVSILSAMLKETKSRKKPRRKPWTKH